MGIAAILALIDGGACSEATIRTAVSLGRGFNAYVEMLHVQVDPDSVIPVVAEGMSGAAVGQIMDSTRQGAEKRAEEVHRLFQDVARKEGLTLTKLDAEPEADRFAVAWNQVVGREGSELAHRGRLFDLVVVPQPDEAAAYGGLASLEAALFETGRPILIAPSVAITEKIRHPAVAWSATRESARAVGAAQPFLERAKKATVMTILEDDFEINPVDLARHLVRHGIAADTKILKPGGLPVGEQLLEAATAIGADLLVMGGYGHSRLRELVLGGATRSVIEKAEIPVLMVH